MALSHVSALIGLSQRLQTVGLAGSIAFGALFTSAFAISAPKSPPAAKTPAATEGIVRLNAPFARAFHPLVVRRIRVAAVRHDGTGPATPAARNEDASEELELPNVGPITQVPIPGASVPLGETLLHTLGGTLPRTGPLTFGPQDVFSGEIDPNIAASDSYLVTTSGGRIRYYSKSGHLLQTDREGNAFDASIGVQELFAPLFQGPGNINENLNLPAGLPCDSTIFVFDPNLTAQQKQKTAGCMDDVYDARVVFDNFRKRFWIVASTRNESGATLFALPNLSDRVGRRDRLLLAVSATEDPREDWNLYVLATTIDMGKCNTVPTKPGPPPSCPGSIFHPSEGGDYPSIGVGKDYVVVTIAINSSNPLDPVNAKGKFPFYHSWTAINVYEADKLANAACSSTCGWNLGPIDLMGYPGNHRLHGIVAPVHHHGAVDPGWNLLTQPIGNPARLLLLAVKGKLGKKPALTGAFVPIEEFHSPTDIPQPVDATSPSPVTINIRNMGSSPLQAIARGRRLVTVFQDCRNWTPNQSECSGAIRLVAVNWRNALGNPTVSTSPVFDRTFGRRNVLDDPVNALVWYGTPGVEVNGAGDVVVVYNRGGARTSFGASYTALMHGESDVRPSAVLHAGETTVTSPKNPCCHMDTAGIATDPADDRGIWMLHAYAKAGSPAALEFAIGRVFGEPRVDLTVWTGTGIRLPSGGLQSRGTSRITVHVTNDGDKRYDGDPPGGGHGTISLRSVRGTSNGTSAHFDIPALDPGQGADVPVDVNAPARGSGFIQIRVRVAPQVPEYSTTNNFAVRLAEIVN